MARRIKHKNVCSLWANGYEGNVAYVAMELVEGRDLRQLLRERGQLPWLEACQIAVQGAEGLQAIHEAGVIHRDLKAANVMIDAQGVVRLVDFGIAKASLKDAEAGRQADSSITDTGQVVGSVEYMSPEQVRAAPLDARSDIYSFGIVLFELFTGRVPFRGDTPMSTMLKHLEDPPPLDGPVVALWPPDLLPILHRALAKTPEDRYPSTRALLADLRHLRASLEDASTESRAVSVASSTEGSGSWRLVLASSPRSPHRCRRRSSPSSRAEHREGCGARPFADPATHTMAEPTPAPALAAPPASPSRTPTPSTRQPPTEPAPSRPTPLSSPTTTLPPAPPYSPAPDHSRAPRGGGDPSSPPRPRYRPIRVSSSQRMTLKSFPRHARNARHRTRRSPNASAFRARSCVEILVDEDGHVATPNVLAVRVSPDNQEAQETSPRNLASTRSASASTSPRRSVGFRGKSTSRSRSSSSFRATRLRRRFDVSRA